MQSDISPTVEFEKIVPEGKALGYWDGRACFAVGPLPGETAVVRPTKVKARYAEAALERIVMPSSHRHEAAEDHYMLCAPWQGVDYAYQLELKRQMLAETFGRPELGLEIVDMVAAPAPLRYRNKLEFSLLAGPDAAARLAFHERDLHNRLVALPEGCVLGSDAMNAAAREVLARLNTAGLGSISTSLMIRQSHSTGELLAVVRLSGKASGQDWPALFAPDLAGMIVYRTDGTGARRIMWQHGTTRLSETVGGITMSYSYGSFFQTNVPAFELALEHILAALPPDTRVADLYGGVGAIGLSAARRAREVVGVESDAAAAEEAQRNAYAAGLTNYESQTIPAEHIGADVLKDTDCVIVDPPRAGLHPRVVDTLLAAAPRRIIYLSCNPVTQARDLMALNTTYQAGAVTGFDFYPGTLHIESLVVLERRKG